MIRNQGKVTVERVRFVTILHPSSDRPGSSLIRPWGTTSERVLRKSHCPFAVIQIKCRLEREGFASEKELMLSRDGVAGRSLRG